jgi:2-polyprenyl-3-methyl-5-hydroxy-6-metoxy-1,4-benzoquinol methylase
MGQVEGLRICDLACGEGYLSRELARRGALVTGVDISSKLLDLAASESAGGPSINYVRDDARQLHKLEANAFHVVVCNLALMDIPNLGMVYQTVWRVLKHNGQFLASLLHPCFETPFTA